MGFIWTIIIGFIVGVIAKFVHPGRDEMGIVVTTLIGIGGALVAGLLGRAVGWYQPDQPAGFITSVLGAVLLLWIFGRLRRKTA